MKTMGSIMLTLRKFGTIVVMLCISLAASAYEECDHHMMVRVMPESQARLWSLFQFQQLDLNQGDTPGTAILFACPEDLQLLEQEGYPYEVLQDDVENFYAARLGNNPLTLMGGYRTYSEIVAELDSIHTAYPDITTAKFSIGNSVEGRPQWVIKISDNPDSDENEPEVFYNTLMHPREIVTSEVIFYFIHYLLDNYGMDPEITELVNSRELFFLPCVNPDGHVYNQQTNPNGGGLWRKNRRNNGDGSYGVDVNRNFSVAWGIDNEGSSPIPSNLAYRGPYPFSEPEAQNLRDFVNSRHFVLSLDYHSYGNHFLFPWGTSYYDGDGLTAEDAVFRMLTDSMAYFVEQVYGTVYPHGTGWELYYNTNGNPFDWDYCDSVGHGRIFSISPEAGTWDDGFWPTIERADSIREELLPANLFFARIAGQLAPPGDITISYQPSMSGLLLRWSSTGAPMYRIWSSASPDGPFDSLILATTSTTALVSLPVSDRQYYIVRAGY
jgi:hypothetical protein